MFSCYVGLWDAESRDGAMKYADTWARSLLPGISSIAFSPSHFHSGPSISSSHLCLLAALNITPSRKRTFSSVNSIRSFQAQCERAFSGLSSLLRQATVLWIYLWKSFATAQSVPKSRRSECKIEFSSGMAVAFLELTVFIAVSLLWLWIFYAKFD